MNELEFQSNNLPGKGGIRFIRNDHGVHKVYNGNHSTIGMLKDKLILSKDCGIFFFSEGDEVVSRREWDNELKKLKN